MTTASQDTGATAIRVEAGSLTRHSTLFKASSAVAFALLLAMAPAPAFAQHGGGGGGGGGAHGGGGGGHVGGGGGHVGGGSGGGGSHGGGASASAGGGSHASGASASGGNNSGGHWWNPFHSGASASAKGSSSAAGNGSSGTNATANHFAAGNNTWQEPPAGHGAAGVNHYAPAAGSRPVVVGKQPTNGMIGSAHRAGAVAGPPHVFPPHRGGNHNFFYYPYPYFGFGWGGGLWWGGFYPCDPFWGCYGYGYGYGGGYGFYGGSFGGDYGDYSGSLSYNSSSDEGTSQEPNPTLYAAPEGEQGAGETSQQPYVILFLKDGSSYAVSDYWLAGGKLHYVTSYGGENVIDESQLDLQRTVNENATRGMDFTLRPEPAGNNEAAPGAEGAPNSQPPAPQQ